MPTSGVAVHPHVAPVHPPDRPALRPQQLLPELAVVEPQVAREDEREAQAGVAAEGLPVGECAIVTLQYISTTLCQVSYHNMTFEKQLLNIIQLFFKSDDRILPHLRDPRVLVLGEALTLRERGGVHIEHPGLHLREQVRQRLVLQLRLELAVVPRDESDCHCRKTAT